MSRARTIPCACSSRNTATRLADAGLVQEIVAISPGSYACRSTLCVNRHALRGTDRQDNPAIRRLGRTAPRSRVTGNLGGLPHEEHPCAFLCQLLPPLDRTFLC